MSVKRFDVGETEKASFQVDAGARSNSRVSNNCASGTLEDPGGEVNNHEHVVSTIKLGTFAHTCGR
jgi:hypothetical protein